MNRCTGAKSSHLTRQSLLLVPRGYHAPMDLLDGLRRRNVSVREVCDTPAVMVALALRQYATLVVVEPDAWCDLPALCAAVRQYYPALVIWQYRHDGHPRLAPLRTGGGPASAKPTVSIQTRPISVPEPATADGSTALIEPVHEPARSQVNGACHDDRRDEETGLSMVHVALTEEELAMLLDDGSVEENHD